MIKVNNIIAAFTAVLLLASCGNDYSTASEATKTSKAFTIDDILKANNVKVGSLDEINMGDEIAATGVIKASPQGIIQVHTSLGGFIKQIHVLPGQEVNLGAKLFTLSHPDIVGLQQQFLEEEANYNKALADWERKQILINDGSISIKVYQESESLYKVSESRLNTLRASLQSLNINPQHIIDKGVKQTIDILAASKGVVSKVMVHTGEFVVEDARLAEIVDRNSLMLELQVKASDITRIAVGQKVDFVLGTEKHQARVVRVSPEVGENNFAIAFAEILATENNYKAGLYTTGKMALAQDTTYGLPLTAIYEDGGQSYALEVTETDFIPLRVQTGRKRDNRVEIINYKELLGKKLALNKVKYLGAADEE